MFYASCQKNIIWPKYKGETVGLLGWENFFNKKNRKFHSANVFLWSEWEKCYPGGRKR